VVEVLKDVEKADIRRKLAKLIVKEAYESKSAIVLEDLPRRAPEHMIKDVKDPQLRLRIYRSAFSSMKNAIVEKAREFGVPVVLVNPSYTSSLFAQFMGLRSFTDPMGALPQGSAFVRRGRRGGTGTWLRCTI